MAGCGARELRPARRLRPCAERGDEAVCSRRGASGRSSSARVRPCDCAVRTLHGRAKSRTRGKHATGYDFLLDRSRRLLLAQVLELVARGLANRTIAAELRIAESTVEQYVTALLVRAGVESRAALVARILWD